MEERDKARKTLVCDIEADGLLEDATTIWVVEAKELNGDNWLEYRYDRDDFDRLYYVTYCLQEWYNTVWHNGIEYDFSLLRKLVRPEFPNGKTWDTLVMSRFMYPDRPTPEGCSSGPHSLDAWGMRLGHPKEPDQNWKEFSPSMVERCKKDCLITEKLFNHLYQFVEE